MNNTPDRLDAGVGAGMEETIDLMDLLTRFVLEWRKFVLVAGLIFIAGAVKIYAIKPLYEASASIMPQSREDSGSVAAFFTPRSSGDVFVGLLSSRSVADQVIDQEHLLELYHTTSRGAARGVLASRSVFAVGRDTLISVKVRDPDADASRRITNAYLDALVRQREGMLAAENELRSHFFEQQVAHESDVLAEAEQELKEVEERSGVVQPEAQTSIGLNAIASARAQRSNLETQLSSLLLSESEQNPEVKALRAQINQLAAHVQTLESANAPKGDASINQMPGLNLEYTRKQRAVHYHETLLNSLSTQYQESRAREGYTGSAFVIVDRAITPEFRAWPPRRTLLMLDLALSLFAGGAFLVLVLIYRRLKAQPSVRAHGRRMRQGFSFRRRGA